MNIFIFKYMWILNICGDSFGCRIQMCDNNKSHEGTSPDACQMISAITWVHYVIRGCVLWYLWVLLTEEYKNMWIHLIERKYRIIKYMINPKEIKNEEKVNWKK